MCPPVDRVAEQVEHELPSAAAGGPLLVHVVMAEVAEVPAAGVRPQLVRAREQLPPRDRKALRPGDDLGPARIVSDQRGQFVPGDQVSRGAVPTPCLAAIARTGPPLSGGFEPEASAAHTERPVPARPHRMVVVRPRVPQLGDNLQRVGHGIAQASERIDVTLALSRDHRPEQIKLRHDATPTGSVHCGRCKGGCLVPHLAGLGLLAAVPPPQGLPFRRRSRPARRSSMPAGTSRRPTTTRSVVTESTFGR